MFGLFKTDPVQKLKKQASKMYEEAMNIQRSGDLKLYAEKMRKIDELEKQIQSMQSQ